MKAYTKPVMQVEIFEVNDTIATCENPTTYDPIEVDCDIKAGSVDGIYFDDGKGICSYFLGGSAQVITISSGTKYQGYTLNAGTYLIWYGPASGSPSGQGAALMNYLVNQGISKGSGNKTIHAGRISDVDYRKIINASL